MYVNDTELRLEQALQRLLDGIPVNTPRDGKINIKRINDEAGLSNRNIYYYSDFVERAKTAIADYESMINRARCSINEDEVRSVHKLAAVKEKVKKEKRLKEQYREQRNDARSALDQLVIKNVSLAFRVLELENEARLLESSNGKVVKIPSKSVRDKS